MIKKNLRKQYFNDLIVINYLDELHKKSLLKTADEAQSSGVFDSITSSIKNSFESILDKNNPIKSIFNFLAPGAISMVLGGGPIGFIAATLLDLFGVDFYGIIKDILSYLSPALHSGEGVSEQHLSSATDEALSKVNLDSPKTSSYDYSLYKTAGLFGALGKAVSGFFKRPLAGAAKKSFLSSVLRTIFRVVLRSAGVMGTSFVAGKTLGVGKYSDEPKRSIPKSTQTFFKIKSSYTDTAYNTAKEIWSENLPNTSENISNLIIDIAEDVYDGLDKYRQLVKTSLGFRKVFDEISFVNRLAPGAQVIAIPRTYSTEKDIADMFIDEVAKKAELAQLKAQQK